MAGAAEGGARDANLQDRIATAVIERFDALPGRGKPQGNSWTVLAGIVAEDSLADTGLRVLALATGTRCVGISALVAGRGTTVHDCHAEVLCRRAFHRYLLHEIGHGEQSSQCILERNSAVLSWSLKPSVKLHFYVSELPCGECALVPISSSSEGTLSRKRLQCDHDSAPPAPLFDRNRTGAKPANEMPEDPRREGGGFHHSGVLRYKSGRSDLKADMRNLSYSCSDKLCRWNHTGWQGALLARLVKKPLLMHSVVIAGPLFDSSFVRQALFERAGTRGDGICCPDFQHTSVLLPCSRVAVETTCGNSGAKVSTTGLSVVWSAGVGMDDRQTRSISPKVPGFYDVLIGHTGERQGRKGDRQAQKQNSAAKPPPEYPTNSWVSPLCKRLLAQDVLESLEVILGSTDAFAQWLRCGAEQVPPADSAAEEEGSELPSAMKRRRTAEYTEVAAPCLASRPDYEWLKEIMAGSEYRARRQYFHSCNLFSHWRRKCSMEAHSAEPPSVSDVDSFQIDMPAVLTCFELNCKKGRDATLVLRCTSRFGKFNF